ncbi:MAG TPA: pteridine reductase [Gammaproteobacteria bacterium]|nr:pteridine reductase [Gammaproteobacteria bacterium]
MQNQQNKVALVTGAARRVGAAIARHLHRAGFQVVLHYRESEVEAAALCAELNQARPHSCASVRADLTEAGAGEHIIKAALAAFGRLDVLVNNASQFYKTAVGSTTEAAFNDLMNANVKAPYFITQAASEALKASDGAVINIIDIHGQRPLRDYAVYSMSKAALWMMTQALAKELAPNVRVNGVAPGAIAWPEGENALSSGVKDKIINETLLKRHGSAEDIASAVVYLASGAPYVTGQVLVVDGGRLC